MSVPGSPSYDGCNSKLVQSRHVTVNGEMVMLSGHQPPRVEVDCKTLRIGCTSISREAFLLLAKKWDEYLGKQSGVIQE